MNIKNDIFKSKSEENILQKKTSSIRLIYNNNEENTKNKINISPMFILLIMIIMVLQEISLDIFYKSNLRALDFWMLELPLLSYLNLKYFKFKIYRHHKLAIYLNVIISGILKIIYLIFSISFYNKHNDKQNNKDESSPIFKCYYEYWGVIPLGIITYLIFMASKDFALTEIKVLIDHKYFSPIKLLIFYGIIGTIITTIIGIISSFVECKGIYSALDLKICKIENNGTYLENFKIWWEEEINISGILLILFGIIMNFFYRLFYILIIKNLTAIHIIFSYLFYATLLSFIGNIFYSNNDNKDVIDYNDDVFHIILFIIIIIMSIIFALGLLIYLEIIELNFCKLNYNLKNSIIERSIQDYDLEIDNEEDDIKD